VPHKIRGHGHLGKLSLGNLGSSKLLGRTANCHSDPGSPVTQFVSKHMTAAAWSGRDPQATGRKRVSESWGKVWADPYPAMYRQVCLWPGQLTFPFLLLCLATQSFQLWQVWLTAFGASGASLVGFEYLPYHLLARWVWVTNYPISLSFLICKIQVIIVFTLCRTNWAFIIYQALRTVSGTE
jgi:hypothetical protein